jgi:hypothetical protein
VWKWFSVILAGCALLAFSVYFATRTSPTRLKQRWEYGTLRVQHKSVASWRVGTDVTIGVGHGSEAIHSLEKKLWGAADPGGHSSTESDDPEVPSSVGALLDRLGREGWELAGHTSRAEGQDQVTVWTFKRPLP